MSDSERLRNKRIGTVTSANGVRKPWVLTTGREPALALDAQLKMVASLGSMESMDPMAFGFVTQVLSYFLTYKNPRPEEEVWGYSLLKSIMHHALNTRKFNGVSPVLRFLLTHRQEKIDKPYQVKGDLKSSLYYLSEAIRDESEMDVTLDRISSVLSDVELCRLLVAYLLEPETYGTSNNPLPFQMRGIEFLQVIGAGCEDVEIKKEVISGLANSLPFKRYFHVFRDNPPLQKFATLGIVQLVAVAEYSNNPEVIAHAVQELSGIACLENQENDPDTEFLRQTIMAKIHSGVKRLEQLLSNYSI